MSLAHFPHQGRQGRPINPQSNLQGYREHFYQQQGRREDHRNTYSSATEIACEPGQRPPHLRLERVAKQGEFQLNSGPIAMENSPYPAKRYTRTTTTHRNSRTGHLLQHLYIKGTRNKKVDTIKHQRSSFQRNKRKTCKQNTK